MAARKRTAAKKSTAKNAARIVDQESGRVAELGELGEVGDVGDLGTNHPHGLTRRVARKRPRTKRAG